MFSKAKLSYHLTMLGLCAGLMMNLVWAGGPDREIKIKLKTDDFEMSETDLSHLEIGDSETLYTEDGKEIFVTRHEQGMTVEVDGKTIEMLDSLHAGHGDGYQVRKIIRCHEGEECETEFDGLIEHDELQKLHHGDGYAMGYRVEKILECSSEDDCTEDVQVWVDESDGDVVVETDGDSHVFVVKRHYKHDDEEI